MVRSNAVMTPLWALCDVLGVPRIEYGEETITECNSEKGNCITFISLPNTNGDGPYDSKVNQGPTREKQEDEVKNLMQYTYSQYNKNIFDYTFMFAGLESGEGGDRHDHNWVQEVFHFLEHF